MNGPILHDKNSEVAKIASNRSFRVIPRSEAKGVRTLQNCQRRGISSNAADTMSTAVPFRLVCAHSGEILRYAQNDAGRVEFLSCRMGRRTHTLLHPLRSYRRGREWIRSRTGLYASYRLGYIFHEHLGGALRRPTQESSRLSVNPLSGSWIDLQGPAV